MKLGIALPQPTRAPRWAGNILNLLIGEPAIKIEAVYQFRGFPKPQRRLFGRLWNNARDESPFQEVRIAVKPACCFVEVPYDASNGLTPEAQGTLAKRELDLLVWLHHLPLVGSRAKVARLGLWRFAFDGNEVRLLDQQEGELGRVSGSDLAEACGLAAQMFIRKLLDQIPSIIKP